MRTGDHSGRAYKAHKPAIIIAGIVAVGFIICLFVFRWRPLADIFPSEKIESMQQAFLWTAAVGEDAKPVSYSVTDSAVLEDLKDCLYSGKARRCLIKGNIQRANGAAYELYVGENDGENVLTFLSDGTLYYGVYRYQVSKETFSRFFALFGSIMLA